MAGAAKITSLNSITAGRSPIALGGAFHLDANAEYSNAGVVTLPDFLNPSLVMSPLSGTFGTPTNPVIQTENGFKALVIGASSGMAVATYSALSGINEASMYLVAKLNVPGSGSSGVFMAWDAVFSASSAVNQGFTLRRNALNGDVQFLVDSGTPTTSVFATPPTTTDYMVIAFGWSVANNLAYLNFNGAETTAPMGSVVGPSGSGPLSIGYRPNYAAQSGSLTFRLGMGFPVYHSLAARTAMINTLKGAYGIS